MQSNSKITLAFTLLLASCGSGEGYQDAPHIANPTMAMVDQSLRPIAQSTPQESQESQEPDQAAYSAEPEDDRTSGPGAGYDVPDQQRYPAQRHARPVARPVEPSMPMPADLPGGAGPRGTSDGQRYDAVGYASWYGEEMRGGRTASGQPFNPGAITVAHNSLPLGSFVEVTALDSGKTIIALVNDRGPHAANRLIDLSRGAAQLLGIDAVSAVRVRLTSPAPADQNALRSGRAASPRIDAPLSLLTALRHKLPASSAMASRSPTRQAAPTRPTPGANYGAPGVLRAAPQSPARGGAGFYVQVAALSNETRARELAADLGGRVATAGSIHRVQIGPFANTALAQRARDDVARRGYGDARIVQTN